MATTRSPLLALSCFCTITISPSNIPASIIESPEHCNVNIDSLLGISEAGSEKKSFGFSIASIGLPHATLPNKGTDTTSSSLLDTLVSNSLSTNNSIVLNLEFSFLMNPLLSSSFK